MCINLKVFVREIFSKASLTGWEVVCNNNTFHGFWISAEKQYHINNLEIRAAYFALKCFAKDLTNYNITPLG